MAKLVRGEATTRTVNGNRDITVAATVTDANGQASRRSSSSSRSTRGQVFTILAEFGDRAPASWAPRPARCTTRSAEPAARRQLHVLGRRLQQGALRGPVQRRRRVVRRLLRQAVRRAATRVDGDVTDWVQVPGNASTYGDNAVEDFGGSWPFIADSADAWYDAQVAAGRSPDADQGRARRRSTCGTATTSTATATSTSPTATSTTSRRSTPVRARRPAAAPRARTPSGRTAGTSTPPTSA